MRRWISILTGTILLVAILAFGLGALAVPAYADDSPARRRSNSFPCDAVTEIPRSECEALVALYVSTDGTHWRGSKGWLATNTPCKWHGVRCSAGHVVGLDLAGNWLDGELGREIVDLVFLESLDLSDSMLSGTVPLVGHLVRRPPFLDLGLSAPNGTPGVSTRAA